MVYFNVCWDRCIKCSFYLLYDKPEMQRMKYSWRLEERSCPRNSHYELHIADIKITKYFQQKFQNISNSPWGVTQLLLGNNVKNSCIIKKYKSIFTKNFTWLRFQSRSNIGYYYFPPPPGPLRGILALSCMEDYFLIEFSVCGGDIGPLSIFTDLGHRHILGYCL